jgi:hypothetical protein
MKPVGIQELENVLFFYSFFDLWFCVYVNVTLKIAEMASKFGIFLC